MVAAVRGAVSEARERLASVVDADRPTTDYLDALREEVVTGLADPGAAAYPELLDPAAFWTASIAPRIRAVRRAAKALLGSLEETIVDVMGRAETELKSLVDEAASSPDAAARRAEVVDRVGDRLVRLHHLMAEVLTVVPDRESLEE
ncbi:MAG: hypothetical protein D6683_15390, partial [Actinomyces sp.]